MQPDHNFNRLAQKLGYKKKIVGDYAYWLGPRQTRFMKLTGINRRGDMRVSFVCRVNDKMKLQSVKAFNKDLEEIESFTYLRGHRPHWIRL